MKNKFKIIIFIILAIIIISFLLPQSVMIWADAIFKYVIGIIIAIIIPTAITIWNLSNLFGNKKRKLRLALILTIVIGLFDYFALYNLDFEPNGDYYTAVYPFQKHYAISSDYSLSFALPIILGFIGLIVLAFISAEKLTPIVAAASSVFVLIANVLGIFFAIQIFDKDEIITDLFLYLFHFNMLVLSVTHINIAMKEQVSLLNDKTTVLRHKWMIKLYPLINKISQMRMFFFLMIFPVAILLYILLIIFGQGPDGIVKAFTMTADWNFSKQIPPPPMYYDGHYLCTVAAGGHRRLVKPIRYGKRRGDTIIVNRQLCIANAFEELLQDRVPKFHKKVRNFYDTHGYPISKHITSPLRADIIYIIMKPLEWLFLLTLYLFDANPEQRISRQYEWKE